MATLSDEGTFGRLLKDYRVAAGLTQTELADLAGLSRRGIGDLERGARRKPYPATLRQLSNALKLNAGEQAALIAAAHSRRVMVGPQITSLPLPRTSFVGRQRELMEIRHLLDCGHLVTLTGAGGSGKTRLALEVARSLVDASHQDAVALVLLAPVVHSEHVAATIGQSFGIREIAGQRLRDTLVAYLRPRRMLLVLDNFEHVLDAVPLVGDLLSACPELRVLATSREPLHLQQEQEYSVPPLELPPLLRDTPLSLITQSASVELFLQRAAQIAFNSTIADEDARVVAAICLRLDGLPLAIELAAARTKTLSPALLLERLEDRLTVLVGGARDLPARQRTLRDTIAWSHDLLSLGDQRLFRRLAVFDGGCTLGAAEMLTGELRGPDHNALDGLSSLVDKSLVRRESGPGGEPRFVMLETIRDFALEQLEASGEAEVMRSLHADLFADLADQFAPHLASGRRMAWIQRLRADQENFRGALSWAVQSRRAEPGLRIVGALWLWYFLSFREGQGWAEAMLSLPGVQASDLVRSKALFTACVTAWAAGDGPAVARFGMEGVALAQRLGSAERLAYALSVIHSNLPNPRENLHPHFATCLGAAEAAGDAWLLAFTTMCYSIGAAQVGDLETSCEQGRRAVERCRALGDDWLAAISSAPLGLGLLQLGLVDEAEAQLQDALGTLRQMGDWKWVNNTLLGLAMVARQRADYDTMAHHYLESLSVCRDVGDSGNLPLALEGLAATAAAWGNLEAAAQLLASAETAHADGVQAIIPLYEDLFAATDAKVRVALPAADYAAAVRKGRGLQVDQALVAAEELVAFGPV
ncbi:MAG: ATP-binding protein [Chloroflexota bacterium]